MKVVKPNKLGVLTRMFENDQRFYLTVAVLVYFPLDAPKHLLSEQALWPMAAKALAGEGGILDEGFMKPRGEVLVTGACYTKQPVSVSFVRVKLGAVDKRLAVIGDRKWSLAGIPSEPAPFTEMPLDWAHAFGGAGFERNPLGKGFAKADDGARPLPNIEDPKRLVVGPGDKPVPAGFAAYDFAWPQRASKLGTYDMRWFETRFPGVAGDIDLSAYNTAPEDQRIDGFFTGDEELVIENMHPDHARIEGRLAGVAARVFVSTRAPGADASAALHVREIPTHLETVRLFPAVSRGVLIYRGMTEVREDDADDIVELLVGADDPAELRPREHFEHVLETQRDREKAPFGRLSDTLLMPPAERGWQGGMDRTDVHDLLEKEDFLAANGQRRRERERAKLRADVLARGGDPEALGLGADIKGDEMPPTHDIDGLIEFAEKQQQKLEAQRKDLEQRRVEMREKAREVYAARGMNYDDMEAQAKRDAAGPPKFSAAKHAELLRSLAETARAAGEPLAQIEAQLADPAWHAELVASEQQLLSVYRRSVQWADQPVDRQPLDVSEPARAEIEAAYLADILLAPRIDHSGLDLSRLDLAGANLAGALFEGVDLTDANLAGANLEGAVLAHALLKGTSLVGANLTGANLGGARLDGANLAGANLSDAILTRAHIARASFRGVDLSRAQLIETVVGEAVDFGDAKLETLVVYRVDLRGVSFRGASLVRTNFVELSVEGADFSGANLTKTGFVTVDGRGARFRGANLTKATFVHNSSFPGADFSEANAAGANFRGTRLTGALFGDTILDGADLSKTDLEGANLLHAKARGALFIRAGLRGAGAIGVDFMNAILQKADLSSADLRGANLFRADLSRVIVDGGTRIHDAKMVRTRVLPQEAFMNREELVDKVRHAEMISKVDLAGVDLSGIDLCGGIFEAVSFAGAKLPKATLKECVFTKCSLQGTDLSGADLHLTAFHQCRLDEARFDGAAMGVVNLVEGTAVGASFRGASMPGAAFIKADLARADFGEAALERGRFAEALVRGAKFDGALLDKTVLFRMDLTETSFAGARMNIVIGLQCELGAKDFSGMKLTYCQFIESKLAGANFDGAEIPNCGFKGATLTGASFKGAAGPNALFFAADLKGAQFEDARFKQAVFMEANATNASFARAKLEQAMFGKTTCEGASFAGATLTYADFGHADIRRADFSGASLFRTRFHKTVEEGTIFTNRSLALGDDPELAEAEAYKPPY